VEGVVCCGILLSSQQYSARVTPLPLPVCAFRPEPEGCSCLLTLAQLRIRLNVAVDPAAPSTLQCMQGSYTAGARMALQQPTWCKLRPEQFDVLANAARASLPENVMFLLGPGVSPHPASPHSSSGINSNSSTTGSRTGLTAHGSSSSSSKAQSNSSGLVGPPMPALQVHQTTDSPGPTAAPIHDAHTISSPSLALQASTGAGSSLQPQPL